MFENESDAKRIAVSLMKRKDCMHISFELPTLLDLFLVNRGETNG